MLESKYFFMRSLWQIISTLVLVTAFIFFSVFSMAAYKDSSIDENATSDKLPIAETVFSVFSYLEKMPTIRLLPSIASGTEYEKQMTKVLDASQVEAPISISLAKKEIEKNIKNNQQNMNLNELWQKLKLSLEKDWSQP